MSPKKKKNVQSVTEQKPESVKPTEAVSAKPSNVEVAGQKEVATADVKEVPQKLIEIPQVDEDTRKMLHKAGFEWDAFVQGFEKINIWAESVDARFNVLLEKMPTEKGIADELVKRSMEERQKLVQQTPGASTGNAGGGGMGLGQIMNVVEKVLGDEGSNPLQEKMNKFFGAVLDKQLESINKPSRFEALLDEELMKAKAKAIAAVVTTP